MMELNEYQRLAMRTSRQDTTSKEDFDNAVLGLASEAGELAGLHKKVKHQGHRLYLDDVRNEIGDILWYCALMAETIGYSLSGIAEGNIEKLHKRYPEGFDMERSINREE